MQKRMVLEQVSHPARMKDQDGYNSSGGGNVELWIIDPETSKVKIRSLIVLADVIIRVEIPVRARGNQTEFFF